MTVCRLALPPACPGVVLGAIRGLAFDDCRNLLSVTDGRNIAHYEFSSTPCALQIRACCTLPTGLPDLLVGLCREPSHPTSHGPSCTIPNCAPCATMQHETIGDPTLGNPSFALVLTNAPSGGLAAIAINVGACTAPGVPLPGFCSNLLVPLPGITVFSGPTGGAGGCTGGLILPLAIPAVSAFCGATLSSQGIVLCPTAAGTGTGVANCLSWTITSS